MLDPVKHVALADDDDDLRDAIRQTLELAGYSVQPFADAGALLAAIDADFAGIVVSDVRMPRMSGVELFHALHARDAELPVILVTAHGDVAMAVAAMRAGAWDFLSKPFDPEVLIAAVARATDKRSLVLDNRRLRRMVDTPDTSALVGRSPAIVRLRDTIAALADADIDVFVEGETGTGKELIARMLHRGGRRARHAFVPIACAALPDALIESELGGEAVPGRAPRGGRVAEAGRGTLFLDDVDAASPALQARLAQIVEDRAIRPLDGRPPQAIDLRVVACGGGGIDDAVRDGRFQPALFYRLAAVRLRVPPLRERAEDVPLLFAHLLDTAAARLRRPVPALTAGMRHRLIDHGWPGNVRELAHFADRVMLGLEPDGDEPAEDGRRAAGGYEAGQSLADAVALFEQRVIREAIVATGGDIGAAIERLGLPRKTFYYKVKRHDIDLRALRRELR